MAAPKTIIPFSPEDMKRRRSRSIAMALLLLAFIAIVFVTSLYKMKEGGNW